MDETFSQSLTQKMDFLPPKAPKATLQKSTDKPTVGLLYNNKESLHFELPVGSTVIGRAQGCKIQIFMPTISRIHAKIEASGAHSVFVTDLGSSNHTQINNHILETNKAYQLTDRATIKFGKFAMKFKAGKGMPRAQTNTATAHMQAPLIELDGARSSVGAVNRGPDEIILISSEDEEDGSEIFEISTQTLPNNSTEKGQTVSSSTQLPMQVNGYLAVENSEKKEKLFVPEEPKIKSEPLTQNQIRPTSPQGNMFLDESSIAADTTTRIRDHSPGYDSDATEIRDPEMNKRLRELDKLDEDRTPHNSDIEDEAAKEEDNLENRLLEMCGSEDVVVDFAPPMSTQEVMDVLDIATQKDQSSISERVSSPIIFSSSWKKRSSTVLRVNSSIVKSTEREEEVTPTIKRAKSRAILESESKEENNKSAEEKKTIEKGRPKSVAKSPEPVTSTQSSKENEIQKKKNDIAVVQSSEKLSDDSSDNNDSSGNSDSSDTDYEDSDLDTTSRVQRSTRVLRSRSIEEVEILGDTQTTENSTCASPRPSTSTTATLDQNVTRRMSDRYSSKSKHEESNELDTDKEKDSCLLPLRMRTLSAQKRKKVELIRGSKDDGDNEDSQFGDASQEIQDILKRKPIVVLKRIDTSGQTKRKSGQDDQKQMKNQSRNRELARLKSDLSSSFTEFAKGKRNRKSSVQSSVESSLETSRCSSRTRRSEKNPIEEKSRNTNKSVPKICFTGLFEEASEWAKVVKNLGGKLVHTVEECTVLVSDNIKRTAKFFYAIGLGKQILSLQWIKDSKAAGKFVDPEGYTVKDEAIEAKYDFDLRETLQKAKEQKLYEGYSFYVMANSTLNKGKIEEMERMITASGGVILRRSSCFPPNTIIISDMQSLPHAKKLVAKQVDECTVHNTEFILTGILRQTVDLESFAL